MFDIFCYYCIFFFVSIVLFFFFFFFFSSRRRHTRCGRDWSSDVCSSDLIIGKGGQEVDKLKEELKKITNKEVQINIFEIKRPELDAYLAAASIARQIESRISYRRAIKMAIAAAMRMNAEGMKVMISGRLNGAEMARSESFKEGRIPLSTRS